MQVRLYIWAGTVKNLPKWFVNNTIVDFSLEKIQELLDAGINVMLWHNTVNEITIFVDDGKFSHR